LRAPLPSVIGALLFDSLDEGPRFPVVDPDGVVLLMREWKALRTNQQYQTMDAMDAVVTKHRTIDLRAEKIVLVVNWMGMDTNSRANVKGGSSFFFSGFCD
jgi:hypothetical protein